MHDQSKVDSFLDRSWDLVAQLHQWLSKSATDEVTRLVMVDLIGDLQSVWTSADDLQLNRIARLSLSLEQLLERICAQNLIVSDRSFSIATEAISNLQDMLLSYEATRDQPDFPDPTLIRRIERYLAEPCWSVPELDLPFECVEEFNQAIDSNNEIDFEECHCSTSEIIEEVQSEALSDQNLLIMLAGFVNKIDDTCHQLHVRMVADETPYVSTTSRLEHLAQSTRDLVNQLLHEHPAGTTSTIPQAEDLQPTETLQQSAHFPELSSFRLPTAEETQQTLHAKTSVTLQRIDEEHDTSTNRLSAPAKQTSAANSSPEKVSPEQPKLEPKQTPSLPKVRRILILDQSHFYRQLIEMAVESAGFQSRTSDFNEPMLQELTSTAGFDAVIVGPESNEKFVLAIDHHRKNHGTKVIRMTATGGAQPDLPIADETISRSNPPHMIAALNRMFNSTSDRVPLSA